MYFYVQPVNTRYVNKSLQVGCCVRTGPSLTAPKYRHKIRNPQNLFVFFRVLEGAGGVVNRTGCILTRESHKYGGSPKCRERPYLVWAPSVPRKDASYLCLRCPPALPITLNALGLESTARGLSFPPRAGPAQHERHVHCRRCDGRQDAPSPEEGDHAAGGGLPSALRRGGVQGGCFFQCLLACCTVSTAAACCNTKALRSCVSSRKQERRLRVTDFTEAAGQD